MNKKVLLTIGLLTAVAAGGYVFMTSSATPTTEANLPAVEPPPVTPSPPALEAGSPPAASPPVSPAPGPGAESAETSPAPETASVVAPVKAPVEGNLPAAASPDVVSAATSAEAATAASLDEGSPHPAETTAAVPREEKSTTMVEGPEITIPAAARTSEPEAPIEPTVKPAKAPEPVAAPWPVVTKSKPRGWAALSPEEREGKHDLNAPVDEKEWRDITRSVASIDVTSEAGETMADVAKRVYGDSHLWPKLWSLNPLVGNPYTMKAGTHLKVK